MYTIKQSWRLELGHRTWTQDMTTGRGHEFYRAGVVADKCANLHGHTLFLAVTLEGPALDDQFFLMDTDLLTGAMAPILADVDHAFVVGVKDPLYPDIKALLTKGGLKMHEVDFSPTFEALVRYFHDRLDQALRASESAGELRIREVKLTGEQTVEATYSA